MDQMKAQAEHYGTRFVHDVIVEVDFDHRPFTLTGDSGTKYTADSVIIATGAQARWLGLPSETKYQGFGVSACATCDGFFYRGKEVVVVGGGNTALEEALFLTNFASKVTMIHRRGEFRGEPILQDRVFKNPKIEVIWNAEVEEVVGSAMPPSVTGIKIRDAQRGHPSALKADALSHATGQSPATAVFSGNPDKHPGGYLKLIPGTTETNIAGVFAAGDVTDDVYRQAVTAAGMGCMAALEAERYLAGAPETTLTAAAE
jgi:thioredoxin reductase (NADPH)